MAITPKEKELVAVGISVASGCKPCTDFHINAAHKARASDEEIKQAVTDALGVRKRAMEIMGGYALAQLGEPEAGIDASRTAETSRIKELIAVGAAFGVNCVSTLEAHLAAAETIGISQEDIAKIVKIAFLIKDRAAFHVQGLVGVQKQENLEEVQAAYHAI